MSALKDTQEITVKRKECFSNKMSMFCQENLSVLVIFLGVMNLILVTQWKWVELASPVTVVKVRAIV